MGSFTLSLDYFYSLEMTEDFSKTLAEGGAPMVDGAADEEYVFYFEVNQKKNTLKISWRK